MDEAVAVALIGVGGVVLGVALTAIVGVYTRRQVNHEQREQARHARELVAAEHLDEALIRASRALDRDSGRSLEDRYAEARAAWEDGWVEYSPRIRQRELLNRYDVVGSILAEVILNVSTTKQVPRHVVARAIANARSTLAHFMRGDEHLPLPAFPEPDDLKRLLGEGDGREDPMAPLKDWLKNNEVPEFHSSPGDP
jgi:hypothetical protein